MNNRRRDQPPRHDSCVCSYLQVLLLPLFLVTRVRRIDGKDQVCSNKETEFCEDLHLL